MKYLQKTEAPEGKVGNHRIERFTVSEDESKLDQLRGLFGGRGRYTPPGTYTRLRRDGSWGCTVVMSDTPDELRDHYSAVTAAKGHCLIHGLGLGIVAEACLRKDDVTKVTVIELSREVIQLIGPYLFETWGERIEIVNADALTWKAPKGERYGMVWHDIWDTICADNLDAMKLLHRRYGRRTDWQGSWARYLCER
jgi:hypothetical protein